MTYEKGKRGTGVIDIDPDYVRVDGHLQPCPAIEHRTGEVLRNLPKKATKQDYKNLIIYLEDTGKSIPDSLLEAWKGAE